MPVRTETWINFLVPVKNRGENFRRMLSSMRIAVRRSRERFVRMLVVDFDSQDLDMEETLVQSGLEFMLIVIRGNVTFSRGLALQRGFEAVKNRNEIIFTLDADAKIIGA